MMQFEHIEYLIGLILILVIAAFYFSSIRWKKKTAAKIGDPLLVKELTSDYSAKKFAAKAVLFSIAFGLCILAIAGLRQPDGSQKIKRSGSDIVIALDVSKSMLAQDVKPNRLARAKQLISRIMDNSPEDRIGLVLFAGRAYLQMPLTLDHAAAKMYLASAAPENIPTQGTVISDALKMSEAAFNFKEKTYKSIILISDGEDHDKDALSVTKALSKKGIMVNTIGIGSPQGAPIMDESTGQYKIDQNGQTVITKLNEEELANIAKAGNGMYELFTTPDEVANNLRNSLAKMGTNTAVVNDTTFANFKPYFQYFLAVAFLILILEFFISDKRKIAKKAILIPLIFIIGMNASFAQNPNKRITEGNKAYNQNNLESAEKEYREALSSKEPQPIANFNLGNVFYRKNKTEEAVKEYDQVINSTKDLSVKQQAFYNKGVAYQKAQKLPECITAYKNALLLNPKDEDARQNLQRALQQQQQQQKKEDQDKKDNKKDNKKNQDKDNKDSKKQDNKEDQQPKPQPSKLSQKDAEEKLKSLNEHERALQDKLNKSRPTNPIKPEKDW